LSGPVARVDLLICVPPTGTSETVGGCTNAAFCGQTDEDLEPLGALLVDGLLVGRRGRVDFHVDDLA
jgi:hypothetical protein